MTFNLIILINGWKASKGSKRHLNLLKSYFYISLDREYKIDFCFSKNLSMKFKLRPITSILLILKKFLIIYNTINFTEKKIKIISAVLINKMLKNNYRINCILFKYFISIICFYENAFLIFANFKLIFIKLCKLTSNNSYFFFKKNKYFITENYTDILKYYSIKFLTKSDEI
ncbi:hypothetical protein (nucleomorph) [Guillardia theta]|uniref:Uncharacterized protein n=1 Tax=Guillardia theta TaxID=55529 RepID=Q98RW0_GUITH|nr:hypothetical protein GTHECHR1048 [Guillardia theta]AAK39840.1 hypothetical protein [Guillardia theta]